MIATTSFLAFGVTQASALGQLSFGGCVIPDGSDGCVKGGLEAPRATSVSPDGTSVYAVGADSTIAAFSRNAAGSLTYTGCVSADGSAGACAEIPGAENPMWDPYSVTVSPDGASVYVTGRASQSLAVFNRAPSGALTWAGCASENGATGTLCATVPDKTLSDAKDVAVSPDGRSVYATGYSSGSIAVFNRDDAGRITYAGCVSVTGNQGTCGVGGKGLEGASDLAISPDGAAVLVTGGAANSVVTFTRQPAGQIAFAGCVSNDGSNGGCVDLPGTPIEGAAGLALSPDGSTAYVAARTSNSVSVFARGGGSPLTFAGCLSRDGSGGTCADLPNDPFVAVTDVVVPPDGQSVYVSATGGSAIDAFVRAPGGQLTFAGCLSASGSNGVCAQTNALSSPTGLAGSPAGDSLYVTASGAASVTHLIRALVPDTTITTGPADGSTVTDATAVFGFTSDQSGVVFECSVDGAAFAACPTPFGTGPLADGQHTFAVRAVNSVGDRDASPAQRTFTVATPATDGPATEDPTTDQPRDTAPPAVRITDGPKGKVRTRGKRATGTLAFEADEPNAAFACSLDGKPATACASPQSYRLRRGKHSITVTATDAAGNTSAPAIVRFTVKRRPHH